MVSEGLHLDSRGLQFLTELAQLECEIASTRKAARPWCEITLSRLTERLLQTRHEAKGHCEQAGISWSKFQEALERSGKG